MRTIDSLRMPVTYSKLLMREHPAKPSLLRNTEINDLDAIDDGDTIPVRAGIQMIRNFGALNQRSDWHLEWARKMADHFHGPLSFALMSAPTLGAGIDTWVRFLPYRIPYFEIEAKPVPGRYRFEFREVVDLDDMRELLVEIPLLITHDYVRTLGASNLELAHVDLAYSRPANTSYHSQWFTCPVHFDSKRSAFEFPSDWCDIPNPAYDAGTWRSSIAKCELVAEKSGSRDLVANARALIAEATEEKPGDLTQEATAQRLHVSVRTLIRHLKQAGTSFQTLRDEALKEKALQLLRRPGLGIHDVASSLGYSDSANFGRAFKRWFGQSPATFRKTIE